MKKIFMSDDDPTEWVICNQDSSYFKSDTLRLYSNINYFYQKSSCCKLVTWRFYKKNAFTRSDLQVCNEPPTGSVLTKNDYFRLKVISSKNGLSLLIKNQISPPVFFMMIDLQEIELDNNSRSKLIVLKRVARK
jgi:hypothetical protein